MSKSDCRVRAYQPGDLDDLCPVLAECAGRSRAWTAVTDRPIMVAGLMPLSDGVAEGWAVANGMDKRILYTLTQYIADALPEVMKSCNIHRVQAHVDPTTPAIVGFMTRIGFEFRTILPAYTSDKRDMALFDMVRI